MGPGFEPQNAFLTMLVPLMLYYHRFRFSDSCFKNFRCLKILKLFVVDTYDVDVRLEVNCDEGYECLKVYFIIKCV